MQRPLEQGVHTPGIDRRRRPLSFFRRPRGPQAVALTVRRGAGSEALAISSFDAQINEAARAKDLTVLEPLD